MSMKQYDIYKNRRIALIGDIPKHWEVKKLKHFAKVNGRIGFRGYTTDDLVAEGNGAYTIGGKHIANCVLDLSSPDFISWEKYYESPEIMVKQGDILMAQRGSLGKVAVVRDKIKEATINPSLVLINGIAINNIFLYYFLISKSTTSYIELINTATAVPMISQNQIENIYAPVPPLNEQEKIANWLDWKVGQIDDIIAEKESIVADMQKYRHSLIHKTVTHGLNSDVALMSSDIDWIGDIPEHWNIKKMKYCIEISNGSDPKTDGNIPVYGSGADSFKTCGEYKNGPTVLIGRKGATLHIPHWVEGRYWNVDTAFDTKAGENYNLRYFYYIASVFDYDAFKSETTLPSMTQSAYENAYIPVPFLAEQELIAEYLDDKTAQIDEIICDLQTQIANLKAYKTSLISEAVTGKIDLREVEIPEPIKA